MDESPNVTHRPTQRRVLAILRTAGKARREAHFPWRGVLAIVASVGLLAAIHGFVHRRSLETERTRILHERTALSREIDGDRARVFTQMEAWTLELANTPWKGDMANLAPGDASFRDRPTLYLRIPASAASSTAFIHTSSQLGTLDGLSSCLLRGTAGGPWPYGEVVARAERLSSSFDEEVRSTHNDLRLRALSTWLAEYTRTDFVTVRAALHAEYAVIAVDESSTGLEAVSAAKGAIRLSVRRLSDGAEIVRVRRTPIPSLLSIQSEGQGAGPNALARAQALGCTMANEALAFADR